MSELNLAALTEWLSRKMPGTGNLKAERISGGQ